MIPGVKTRNKNKAAFFKFSYFGDQFSTKLIKSV